MLQYNKTIQKMINFDAITKQNLKEYNPYWSQIPDQPYRILILKTLDQEKQVHYTI